MMRHIVKIALVSGLVLAFGCGGESDDDGGGGGGGSSTEIDTGLPESTPLEDVSAQQYANACQALRADVNARLGPDIASRGVCEVYGAALSDDPAMCRSTADGCVSQLNSGGMIPVVGLTRADLDFTNFECGDVGELQGCSVTVGEFETCIEDQVTGFETLMAQNNCSNAASVGLTEAAALADLGQMAPASCARVQQECPNVGPFAGL
jgi:hypothetical protein